jgi:uncharacterized glyoxalase superfamily protein PhnB
MITSVIPKLPFIDKQLTIDFYVDQLGFKLRSDYGDYIILDLKGPLKRLEKLESKPWGQKEFPLIDPNGTCLTFGEAYN